jgi:hypothetical protein
MGATRKKHQREMDLEVINTWTIQGKSLRQCAEELAKIRDYEVSYVTIKNDLDTIKARWLENTMGERSAHIARELARIDTLEQTYWQAWEKSLETSEQTTQRTKDTPVTRKDEKGKPVQSMSKQYEASIRKEERDGNPAFLAGVERCIKMRMDLLGLNATVKSDEIVTIKWEVIRDDDSTGSHAKNHPAEIAPGADDYLQ